MTNVYPAGPAATENFEAAPGAVVQVFALSDEARETPLTVTLVTDGSDVDSLVVSSRSWRPAFKHATEYQVVLADDSGEFVQVLTSYSALLAAALAAQAAAEDAQAAAVAVASPLPVGGDTGQALVKASPADRDVAWGAAAGGSGISGAPTTWPTTFPPSPHSHRTADLLKADGVTPLSAVVMGLLSTVDQQSARAAIGAGTSSQTLTVGTGPADVAAGNHTHSQYTTAADVTAMITAAGGGGGTAGSNLWSIAYVSGAYEAVPSFVTFANGYRFLLVAGPVPYTVTPPTGVTVLFSQTA